MAEHERPLKILIINPNTSQSMTEGIKRVATTALSRYNGVHCEFFTSPQSDAPGSCPSIDTPNDAIKSAVYLLPQLNAYVAREAFDGYLVACFSDHPLVEMLDTLQHSSFARRKHVTGIFEASVMASVGVGKFGIVTTGHLWEAELTGAVRRFLGGESDKFAGVATTGMTAAELHKLDPYTVQARIRACTANFVRLHPDVRALCMGCAGMAGLDEAIRLGAVDALGPEKGIAIRIVDGIAAGVQWLVSICTMP